MHAISRERIVVCDLGRTDYLPAWDLQRRVQQRLIRAKRGDPPESIPHVLLLVEHPPVYTLGKSGDESNLLLSEDALVRHGASFHRIDRGGDVTFHGPGQIVGYPLLDLERFFTDVHRYLRMLEETIIRTCAEYGVKGGRVGGRTGVWIGPDDRGPERKICAMGIRCSRWVTMHGFALNVNTDLGYFSHIVPCGITDRDATSLSREVGREIDEGEVGDVAVRHFGRCFDAEIDRLPRGEAPAFLERFVGGELPIQDPA